MNTPGLLEADLLAADAVGEIIEHWGFRKALGRVWTVLYLAGSQMPAAEIGARLSMSSGGVSMSLTELQRWAVVRRVWLPGERREFFEAETDLWKMISKVINERERTLLATARERLRAAHELTKDAPPSAEQRGRQGRLKHLLMLCSLAENMIEMVVRTQFVDFSSLASAALQLTRPRSRPGKGRAST